MQRINHLIEKRYKLIVFVFFAAFLCLGLSIFRDYGVSCDEETLRSDGLMTLRYIFNHDTAFFNGEFKYYGTIYTIFLTVIGNLFKLNADTQKMYFMRHLVNFLLFYTSALFFYRLLKYNFHSWKISLVGVLFLILSPRIFADSFYNAKDIPFLSFFIISMFTLVKYLENKTSLRAVFLHALACALVIDIRIVGVTACFLTSIFFISDLAVLRPSGQERRKSIAYFLLYFLLLISLTVLFWPVLWRKPVYHFIAAFKQMANFPWQGTVLFMGKLVDARDLPWFNIPVLIFITTPLLYVLLFLSGCFTLIKNIFKYPRNFYLNRRHSLLALLWFFFPLFTLITLNSFIRVRHIFFIYPAFLMISLAGMVSLREFIKRKWQGASYRIMSAAFLILIAANLVNLVTFMVKYHPYEKLYFNRLAGRSLREVMHNFTFDSWGMPYKEVLEYIAENDTANNIKVYSDECGWGAQLILEKTDQNRIQYTSNMEEAKYYLVSINPFVAAVPYEKYYSLKREGVEIVVAYKLK